ncbi:aspartate transaminase, partial [Rhizobium ruizarguesonis]
MATHPAPWSLPGSCAARSKPRVLHSRLPPNSPIDTILIACGRSPVPIPHQRTSLMSAVSDRLKNVSISASAAMTQRARELAANGIK